MPSARAPAGPSCFSPRIRLSGPQTAYYLGTPSPSFTQSDQSSNHTSPGRLSPNFGEVGRRGNFAGQEGELCQARALRAEAGTGQTSLLLGTKVRRPCPAPAPTLPGCEGTGRYGEEEPGRSRPQLPALLWDRWPEPQLWGTRNLWTQPGSPGGAPTSAPGAPEPAPSHCRRRPCPTRMAQAASAPREGRHAGWGPRTRFLCRRAHVARSQGRGVASRCVAAPEVRAAMAQGATGRVSRGPGAAHNPAETGGGVTHLCGQPLGATAAAEGPRRRQWLGPRLLLSRAPPAREGRTCRVGGRPPARRSLSGSATSPGAAIRSRRVLAPRPALQARQRWRRLTTLLPWPQAGGPQPGSNTS